MSTVDSRLPNPFPGLRPFRSDEHHLFFGREEQTAALLQLLRTNRFLAVVGTSGSGKSSLVRAGLIAELHGGTMTQAGSTWEVMLLRPGGSPLENLARAMVEADLYDSEDLSTLPRLLATLSRSRFGLVEAMKQSELCQPGTNLLVVVDQFEELFRFRQQGVDSEETAASFVNLLLTASEQTECPIYVAVTMRSDYLGDCSEIPGLAEAVNEGEYLIPRLLRDQKRDAIEKPIGVGGAKISPLLVQRLLNEVGDDPDQLPVLQHALMRMWETWSQSGDPDRPIEAGDFEATGGLASALSNHADEIYDALPDDRHRQVCARIFKTLTEKGDDNRGIRRPTRLAHLQAIANSDCGTVTAVLDAFRSSGVTFLMPGTEVVLGDRTVLDLSHESLMRGWQRLRGWVDDEAQSARIFRRLLDTARLWSDGKAGLFRNPDLQIAMSWRQQETPNTQWAGQYGGHLATALSFLEASNAEAEAEGQAREAARQRELAQAQELAESRQQRLLQQQRSTSRMRVMIAGLGAVAAIAIGTSLVAGKFWRDANVAKLNAQESEKLAKKSEESARKSQSTAQKEAERAKQKAAEAGQSALVANRERKVAQEARLTALDQTYLATRNEIKSMRLARQSGWRSAALERLRDLVQGGSRNLDRVDLRTEALACLAEIDVRLQSKFINYDIGAWYVRYSPDGQTLAINDDKKSRVYLHDVTTNQELRSIPKSVGLAPFAFHPSGTLAVPRIGQVAFYPLRPGQPTFPEITGEGHALNLAFSRSGERLAVIWGEVDFGNKGHATRIRRVVVYETANGKSLWATELPPNTPISYKIAIALSPDGQSFATVGPGGEVRLFSVGENDEPIILGKLDTRICAIDFHPDGQSLVAAGRLAGAVWDLKSRSELFRIHGPEGGFWDVTYSPDGQLLAGAINDRTVRLWDSRSGRELAAVPLEGAGACLSVAFSPRGDRLAAGGGGAAIFEIEGRRECRNEDSATNNVNGLVFGKSQSVLYSCGGDQKVRSWNLKESTVRVLKRTGRRENSNGMRLAPDGAHLALGFGPYVESKGELDFSIGVWRLDDSNSERRLQGPKKRVFDFDFDKSGKQLAATSEDGGLYLWEFETGVLRYRLGLSRIRTVRFLNDSQLVVAAGNRLILLAASDGAPIREVTLPAMAAEFVITPDQNEVLVLTTDGLAHRIRLSDLTIQKSRMVLDHPSSLVMEISPDGKLLVVTTQAGSRNLLIDPRTLEPLAKLPDIDKRVTCVAFDQTGRNFALGGAQIALWDLALIRGELMRLGLDFGEFNANEAVALLAEALQAAADRSGKAKIIETAASLPGVLEKLAEQAAGDGQFQAELASHFVKQGNVLSAEGARAKARAGFEEKLAKEPDNSALATELAELLVRGDPAIFARDGDRIAALKLTDPWAKLAVAYHVRSDQQMLDRLLKHHPAAVVGIGDLYAASKDWERTIVEYSKAITDQTADANLLIKRAIAYEAAKKSDLAAADWLRAASQQKSLAPDVVPVVFRRAQLLLQSGVRAIEGERRADAIRDFQEARDWLRDLHQAFPSNNQAMSLLAISLGSLGSALKDEQRRAEALVCINEARQILEDIRQPSFQDIYNLSCVYTNLSILANPDSASPTVAEREALVDRAIASLQRAIAAGMTDFALMERDHDLDPLRERPNFRALILESTGRTLEAVPQLVLASAAKPKDTLLSLKVATLQAWFGQDMELAATRKRILEFAKEASEVTTADRAAKACSILASTDNVELDAALALARKAVEVGKGGEWNLLALGMAEYRSGNYAAAEKALLAATEAGPNNRYVTGISPFYRAMSLFRQDKVVEARNLAIEAAAKIKPLPKDEKNPLAGNANHDDLISWLAYKEAKALIKFEAAEPPKMQDGKK